MHGVSAFGSLCGFAGARGGGLLVWRRVHPHREAGGGECWQLAGCEGRCGARVVGGSCAVRVRTRMLRGVVVAVSRAWTQSFAWVSQMGERNRMD